MKINNWKIETDKKLQEISMLEENWDSYGAPPINPALIKHTKNILNKIMTDETPCPFIFLLVNAGVQLSWGIVPLVGDGMLFDIDIYNTKTIEYYCKFRNFEEEVTAMPVYLIDKIRRLLYYMYNS